MIELPRLNMTDVTMTKLRKDPAYIEYYMFWAKLILLELIPYIVIFTLNAVIISRILDSRRFRTKMAQVQQVCSQLHFNEMIYQCPILFKIFEQNPAEGRP